MHARKYMTMALVMALLLPTFISPFVSAYTPGDEAAIFGQTFDEEYWTNETLFVEGDDGGNASLTASYVGVDEFSAFLIAFNEITTNDGIKMTIPYQLFGMHYKTPGNQEVFVGAIFAFLLAHNETFGNNDLPDVGNDPTWYVIPVSADNNPWGIETSVEPMQTTKLGDNHYRFGMKYYNLTARIVSGAGASAFWLSLALPILTVLISELEIVYDIYIDETGQVHAETLYTMGQVERAIWLLAIEQPAREIMVPSLKISAVHYVAIFTSNYRVVRSSTGNTLASPTGTEILDDNLTIQVGESHERAFDIGLGREYTLYNESTDPWTNLGTYNAINFLLEAQISDFFLIAWQAPLSVFLFAHMAYALSSQLQNTYANVQALVNNAGTAFANTQLWYGVTFPDWNGSRIEQDPVYVAYTNLSEAPEGGGLGFLLIVGLVGVIAIVILRRRK